MAPRRSIARWNGASLFRERWVLDAAVASARNRGGSGCRAAPSTGTGDRPRPPKERRATLPGYNHLSRHASAAKLRDDLRRKRQHDVDPRLRAPQRERARLDVDVGPLQPETAPPVAIQSAG